MIVETQCICLYNPQRGPPLRKKHGPLRAHRNDGYGLDGGDNIVVVKTQCIASLQSPTRPPLRKKHDSLRAHRNGGYGLDVGDNIDVVKTQCIALRSTIPNAATIMNKTPKQSLRYYHAPKCGTHYKCQEIVSLPYVTNR